MTSLFINTVKVNQFAAVTYLMADRRCISFIRTEKYFVLERRRSENRTRRLFSMEKIFPLFSRMALERV